MDYTKNALHLTDAFLYYTQPDGLFERQWHGVFKKNTFQIYFFAALFAKQGYRQIDLHKSEIFALCEHDKMGSDVMRHAVMLILFHAATDETALRLKRIVKLWKRPAKQLTQLQVALQKRQTMFEQQYSDPESKKRLAALGLLRPPVDVGDLKRLWIVYGMSIYLKIC